MLLTSGKEIVSTLIGCMFGIEPKLQVIIFLPGKATSLDFLDDDMQHKRSKIKHNKTRKCFSKLSSLRISAIAAQIVLIG